MNSLALRLGASPHSHKRHRKQLLTWYDRWAKTYRHLHVDNFRVLPFTTLYVTNGSRFMLCKINSDQIMWRLNYYQLDLELAASWGWTRWWYWVGRQLHHSLSRLVSDWRVLQPSQIAKHTCTSIKYIYITNSSVTVISAGSQIYIEKTTATTASISSPVKWTIVLWNPAILSF